MASVPRPSQRHGSTAFHEKAPTRQAAPNAARRALRRQSMGPVGSPGFSCVVAGRWQSWPAIHLRRSALSRIPKLPCLRKGASQIEVPAPAPVPGLGKRGKRSAACALPWRSACALPWRSACALPWRSAGRVTFFLLVFLLVLLTRTATPHRAMRFPVEEPNRFSSPSRNPAPALPRPHQCLCQGRACAPGG